MQRKRDSHKRKRDKHTKKEREKVGGGLRERERERERERQTDRQTDRKKERHTPRLMCTPERLHLYWTGISFVYRDLSIDQNTYS